MTSSTEHKILYNIFQTKEPFVLFKKPTSKHISFLHIKHVYKNLGKIDIQPNVFVCRPFSHKEHTFYFKGDLYELPLTSLEFLHSFSFNRKKYPVPNYILTQLEYLELSKQYIERIQNNTISKIVLSRIKNLPKPFSFNPFSSFIRAIKHTPQAFNYYIYTPFTGDWIGSTPEIFLQTQSSTATTVALAGTLSKEKYKKKGWGIKEKEEHEYVSTFIEDILKKHNVLQIDNTEKNIDIHNICHLQKTFTFKFYPQQISNIIEDMFPTPAVCGTPKEKVKQLILLKEPHDRHLYTGILGYIDNSNNIDMYVNIRCMRILKENIESYVGGGLTKHSSPKDEWTETELKSRIMESII